MRQSACTALGNATPSDARCRCATAAASMERVDAKLEQHKHDWGLPSAGCTGNWTHYWTRIYPEQHRRWRAQGRVVAHCTDHTGFGNYLRSIPAALVYSAITEQALTFMCDTGRSEQAGFRQVALPRLLAKYFRGPHFDWAFEPSMPRRIVTVDLFQTQMQPHLWPRNVSQGSRVTSTLSTWPRRVLQFTKTWPYFARYFGPHATAEILKRGINLEGCLLRYLLAPKPVLQRAVLQVTGLPLLPHRLLPVAALHVRAGDGRSFVQSDSKWYMQHDVRASVYDANPAGAFECLARLSRASQVTSQLAAAQQGAAAACMPCVVLSDSSAVEECSRRSLGQPILTPGSSVHLSASPLHLATDATNVQRIFLDWLLLATSAATVMVASDSTFASTAWNFKVASSAGLREGGRRKGEEAGAAWPHLQFGSAQFGNRSRTTARAAAGRLQTGADGSGTCHGSTEVCELMAGSAADARRFWHQQCRPLKPIEAD